MHLKNKFLLLGTLTVALVMVLVVLAELQLHSLQTKEEQRHANLRDLEQASQYILVANVEFKKQVQRWKNILLRGNNPADFTKEKELFLNQAQLVQQALQNAAKVQQVHTGQQEINALLREHVQLGEQYQKILQQFDANDPQSGQKIDRLVRGIDQDFTTALQDKVDLLTLLHSKLHISNDLAANADLRQAMIWIALTSLLCVVILTALMYFILRSVLRQIGGDPQHAVILAKNVARGNLAITIPMSAPHSLFAHLQDMVNGLSDLLAEVYQASKALNKIAHQVETAAAQLAKNSAEQARVVAINSTALEQVAVTVAQNAEHSKQLSLLVDTTPESADLIAEINYASKEQAIAVAENSKNLLLLSRRTDENAQQVEKLSRSASDLRLQSNQLSELIDQFKLPR